MKGAPLWPIWSPQPIGKRYKMAYFINPKVISFPLSQKTSTLHHLLWCLFCTPTTVFVGWKKKRLLPYPWQRHHVPIRRGTAIYYYGCHIWYFLSHLLAIHFNLLQDPTLGRWLQRRIKSKFRLGKNLILSDHTIVAILFVWCGTDPLSLITFYLFIFPLHSTSISLLPTPRP